MADGRQVEQLVSAGGVVCRWGEAGVLEVVLCGRHSPSLWALPKGTPEVGEGLEHAAVREVNEETGLEVHLLEPIGHIEYWFSRTAGGPLCHKRVYFFLMAPVGGSIALHDPEFDVVQWFPLDEALRRMTYENEAGMVRKAVALTKAEKARS